MQPADAAAATAAAGVGVPRDSCTQFTLASCGGEVMETYAASPVLSTPLNSDTGNAIDTTMQWAAGGCAGLDLSAWSGQALVKMEGNAGAVRGRQTGSSLCAGGPAGLGPNVRFTQTSHGQAQAVLLAASQPYLPLEALQQPSLRAAHTLPTPSRDQHLTADNPGLHALPSIDALSHPTFLTASQPIEPPPLPWLADPFIVGQLQLQQSNGASCPVPLHQVSPWDQSQQHSTNLGKMLTSTAGLASHNDFGLDTGAGLLPSLAHPLPSAKLMQQLQQYVGLEGGRGPAEHVVGGQGAACAQGYDARHPAPLHASTHRHIASSSPGHGRANMVAQRALLESGLSAPSFSGNQAKRWERLRPQSQTVSPVEALSQGMELPMGHLLLAAGFVLRQLGEDPTVPLDMTPLPALLATGAAVLDESAPSPTDTGSVLISEVVMSPFNFSPMTLMGAGMRLSLAGLQTSGRMYVMQ